MISAIIVGASLALAALFVAAWLVKPGFRREVEYPKHDFQDQLRRYDRQCCAERQRSPGTQDTGVESDESR